jgi:hypothetical protein
MNPINEIETACKELSEYRAQLRRRHEARQKAIRQADAEHSTELRRLQERCGSVRASLETLIEKARQEFTKPKTRAYHGITVGFEKARDSVALPEDAILVDRIEKLLPAEQARTVLDRSVKVIKIAFKKLPRELLQKLGCSVVSGPDKAVVRANDDDIETLVQKSFGESATATEAQS